MYCIGLSGMTIWAHALRTGWNGSLVDLQARYERGKYDARQWAEGSEHQAADEVSKEKGLWGTNGQEVRGNIDARGKIIVCSL